MSGAPRQLGTLAVLRDHPAFRSLIVARVVSFVGDSLSLVALMLHVAQTTGQALAVAALLLAGDFAPALLSPLTGAISDRFDRRRVMIACELLQALLLVAIALALPPLPLLLVLVGRAGDHRAGVPAGVPGGGAGAGPAARPGVGELRARLRHQRRGGDRAAGGRRRCCPLVGIRGVLLVDAASFAVSALLLTRLPALNPTRPRDRRAAGCSRRPGRGWATSGRSARCGSSRWGSAGSSRSTASTTSRCWCWPPTRCGPASPRSRCCWPRSGIGLLVGYALLARVGAPGRDGRAAARRVRGEQRRQPAHRAGLGGRASAFALQAVRGLGMAAMDVASNTLLQRLVPDRHARAGLRQPLRPDRGRRRVSYVGGGLLLDATSAPRSRSWPPAPPAP